MEKWQLEVSDCHKKRIGRALVASFRFLDTKRAECSDLEYWKITKEMQEIEKLGKLFLRGPIDDQEML